MIPRTHDALRRKAVGAWLWTISRLRTGLTFQWMEAS
jgi:hypothetical protein